MEYTLTLYIKFLEKEKNYISIPMSWKEKYNKIIYYINYDMIITCICNNMNIKECSIEEIRVQDEMSKIFNIIDLNYEINFKDLVEKRLYILIIKKELYLNVLSIKEVVENIKNLKYEMNERFKDLQKENLHLKFVIALILKNTDILQNTNTIEYLEDFLKNNKLEDDEIMNFLNLHDNKLEENRDKILHSDSLGSLGKNLNLNKVQSEILNKNNKNIDFQMVNLLRKASNKAYDKINFKNTINTDFKLKKQLDFQIIYSNPLVRQVAKNSNLNLKIGELNYNSVDYNSECINIIESIKESNIDLNISIDCANYENFIKKIKENPKILHVICHGDIFDEEYSLQLEGNDAELYSLSVNKLKEFLKNINLNISLVFLNACQSEHMGKLFIESGADCVVAVNSLMNIGDDYAKIFSEKFYGLLFTENIIDSFENTKLFMENDPKIKNSLNCCCGHVHKENCKWFELKIGHESHIPNCNCKDKNKYIHSNTCQWSEDFLLSYGSDDCFDNYETTCCCSPELPHDENLKLKLLFKDNNPSYGKIKLFENKINGKVNFINNKNFNNIRFGAVNAKGQNINLYNLYNLVRNRRITICNGNKGSGKKYLIKHLTKYLDERNIYDSIFFISKEEVNKVNDLLITILNKMNVSLRSFNRNWISVELKKIYKNSKMLIIINNLEDRSESIDSFLNCFIDETSVNFLISTDSTEKFKTKYLDFEYYTIKAMTYNMAQYLLLENLPDIPYNDLLEIKDKFLKKHKYPKDILQLAKSINEKYKSNIPLNDIQYLLSKENTTMGSENGDLSVFSHESYSQNILKFFKL